jgi:hypothetical protein
MFANFTGEMLILTFDLLILALAMLNSAKLAPTYAKIPLISPSTQHWNANYADNYAYLGYYYVLERRRIFCFRALALILMTIPIVYVFSSSVLILLSIITGMHIGVLPVCTSTFSTVCTQSNTYVWMDSCVVKNCVIPAITAEIPTFVWANLSMNKHKLNAD